VEDAIERFQRREQHVPIQALHQVRALVYRALEPQLLGLVHHDEQKLVRDDQLFRRCLQREQLARANVHFIVELAAPDLFVQDLVVDRLVQCSAQGCRRHAHDGLLRNIKPEARSVCL
jgi:hypothetical protein